VGIHIAAPGLASRRDPRWTACARAPVDGVHAGAKITMLPPAAVARYTLSENRECGQCPLYLDVRGGDFTVENDTSRIERCASPQTCVTAGREPGRRLSRRRASGGIPFAGELHFLWRLALAFEARRGKSSAGQERPEYNFYVDNDRVTITERGRGTPLDKLVAEMMIRANSSWGRLLDDNGVAAI